MPSSPTIEKGVLRAPESITIPVHEYQGNANKPVRPALKRGVATSNGQRSSAGPFTEVRRAWRKLLANAPSLPVNKINTELLARNTFATAVGVCEGFRVPGYLFDREQTLIFAQELQRALHTDDLVLVIHGQTLYVVNENSITSHAIEALQAVIFVHVDSNGSAPKLIQGHSMPALLHGLNTLLDLTAETPSRVLEASEIVQDNHDLMDTLGDVILGSPVAFCGASRQQLEGAMMSEPCWTVSVGFEGFDPAHDHRVPLCSLPTSLFSEQALDSLDATGTYAVSVSSICDAKHTQYFQRLNSSTSAADIWGDVTINVEGPGPYSSPVSSPTSP